MDRRGAWTLIEVLVVLAILALLAALLIPAVLAARESSRRAKCGHNLHQLVLALHNYDALHGVLPETFCNNYSFHVALLPQIEQQPLYQSFELSVNALDYRGALRAERVALLECPSDDHPLWLKNGDSLAATNYHGNSGSGTQTYGWNGVFSCGVDPTDGERFLPLSAISDGLSATAILSEVVVGNRSQPRYSGIWDVASMPAKTQLESFASACRAAPASGAHYMPWRRGSPWLQGGLGQALYNHVLPPNAPSCLNGGEFRHGAWSASSLHPSVANTALADGSVRPISESIELGVWRKMGSRASDP